MDQDDSLPNVDMEMQPKGLPEANCTVEFELGPVEDNGSVTFVRGHHPSNSSRFDGSDLTDQDLSEGFGNVCFEELSKDNDQLSEGSSVASVPSSSTPAHTPKFRRVLDMSEVPEESDDVDDSVTDAPFSPSNSSPARRNTASVTVRPPYTTYAERQYRRKVSVVSMGHLGIKRNMSYGALLKGKEELSHFCSKLYHTKRKILKLKNYHDEARAMKDIAKFMSHPIVLFKVHHTLWEEIVEEMILSLANEKPELNLDVGVVMKSLICNESDFRIPECIQGITETPNGPITEQSFIVVIGNTTVVTENHVVMCLLEHPFNFGIGAEEVRFICVVICPTKSKSTKSGMQVARTYATLLADDRLRHNLLNTRNPDEFAHEFELECTRIHKEHEKRERGTMSLNRSKMSNETPEEQKERWMPGKDWINDIKERSRQWIPDFTKDVRDCTSISKIVSTTLFLYFALLLPAIAFGVLLSYFTDGKIDAKNVIVGQSLTGLLWAFLSGQHLVVVRTTIPVAIYTKVIYSISLNWDESGDFFHTFYGMIGLINSMFLVLYGLTGVSKIMAYCSRSTEEIVGLFISIAFVVDAAKYLIGEFDTYYCEASDTVKRAAEEACDPTIPLLALLLVLVTVYVGVGIFNFKYSPYLTADKRVIVADYAIVVAVIAGTFLGSYVFRSIALAKFTVNEDRPMFQLIAFQKPPTSSLLAAIGLGFIMSILFFMENCISASIVNNPANKLRGGQAYHHDMIVTGFINAILSLFGLPFVHGSLPHSPLHVRALADIEEHIENGHLTEKIVYVRETRLTTLLSHILIGASVFMIPYPLNHIPIPVLYGLFVFLAITALGELQIWERIVLIVTEQSLYPPFHYVRKVPQKIIHCFTLLQMLQLGVLCVVSFAGSAYLKMFFPFIIILLIPMREKVLPTLISERHLNSLDGEH